MRERRHRLHPVEAGDAGRRNLGQQRLIEFCRPDGLRAVGQDAAFAVQKFTAVIEEEVSPQRHVGVAQAAPDKTERTFLGVGEFFGRRDHLVKGLGNGDAFLLEHLLVVVEDEVVDRPRQRQHLPLVVLGVLQAGRRKIALDEIRRGEIRVLHVAGDIGEPAAFFELPLLHVIAQMNDVEARLARSEFDHGLLALLLLGDLLGFDLDAREFGEFLDVLLQIVAARTLGEDHLELGAGIFLPLHLCARGKASEAERTGGSRTS